MHSNSDAVTLADDTTTVDRIAMAVGGLLAVLGIVADPRLLAAALVVWALAALYAVATG
jgi:hypothetical protein